MEKIEITFLGTGDSIPTKLRNHSAILLSYKSENILIDCGEGTQRQFKISGISPFKLTKLLITHWHGDHILGLPGLFQTLGMLGYTKKLEIYGPKGTKENIALLKKLVNIEIEIDVKEIEDNVFFDDKDFFIETRQMMHTKLTNAYSFVLKDRRRLYKNKLKKFKLPNTSILKKLQEGKDIIFNGRKIKSKDVSYIEKGKKVCFILDTAFNKNAVSLAKNSDLLIIESSFLDTENEQAEMFKHLTISNALKIAKNANVKNLALTHISQRYEPEFRKIEETAKKIFKNCFLAKDFQTVTV